MNSVASLPIWKTVKYLLSNLSSKTKRVTKDSILSLILMLVVFFLIKMLLMPFFTQWFPEISFGNAYFAAYAINIIIFTTVIDLSRSYLKELLLDYYKNQSVEIIDYNNLVYVCYLLGFSLVIPIIFFIPAMFWGAIWNASLQPILNVAKNNNYDWNLSSVLRLVIISWIVTFIIFCLLFTGLIALLFGGLVLDKRFSFDHTIMTPVLFCMMFAFMFLITWGLKVYSILIARLSFFIHLNFPNVIQKNKLITIN